MKTRNGAAVSPCGTSSRLYKSAIAIAVAAACGSSALAADAPAPTDQQSSEALTEVVVTGTRILRRDYSSPSPLVTIGADTLQTTGEVSIDQALAEQPQFNPGNNQFNQAANVQATATSSPGAAELNLRGLGVNRNLVLIDGHRGQPADASLAIDVNTIPTAAIDSIEIVTGGAASTYGADAMAGVVNFKLKRHFEGIQLDASYGETQEQDDRNTNLSALIGSNFADNKGNVMLGITYSNRTAVNVENRGWANAANTDPNTPGGAFPGFPGFNLIPYVPVTGFGASPCNPPGAGPIWDVPSQAAVNSIFGASSGVSQCSALYFNKAPTTAGATIFSPGGNPGQPAAVGYTGGLYPIYKVLSNGSLATNNNPDGPISAPLQRYSFFGNATYEINDWINSELQGYFVRDSTFGSFGTPTPEVNQWGATIPYNSNPALNTEPVPPELAALLNSRPDPNGTWNLNQFPYFLGNRATSAQVDTYQMSVDFNGKTGLGDWTWDVYGSVGQTDTVYDYFGYMNYANYQTLIAAPNYGAGYQLNNALTGQLGTCTSGLNPFVTTPVSADCLAMIEAQLNTTTSLAQRIAEVNLQGGGFDLPGGEARFAFGADYRFDGIVYRPDEGMQAANIDTFAAGIFGANPVSGGEHFGEEYVEADLPVLGNLPGAKKLSLDLGFRHSDYSSSDANGDVNSGSDETWKALLDWQVNDYVTLRGGPQRANRAPNLGELYTPPTVLVTLWPSGDPCSINNVVPWGNTAGNPNQAKVVALCNQLKGVVGTPITTSYPGLGFYFPLALDQQAGNPEVRSESGSTWTIGTVLKSPFEAPLLNHMTATIDYYNITINGAITPLTSQIVYSECLNSNGVSNPNYSPTNFYCSLISRSAIGATNTVNAEYVNIGYVKTSGIDFTFDWHANMSDMGLPHVPGALSVNLALSDLQNYIVQVAPGDAPVNYKGSTGFDVNSGVQFSWKSLLTVSYTIGQMDVSLRWRYLPRVENAAVVLSPTAQVDDTPSNSTFDLFGNWRVNDHVSLRAGIQNLGNTNPPLVGVTSGNSQAGLTDPSGVYDELGRRFYIGVQGKF
jgi:iron complex outermembrane receptor protein